MFNRCLTILFSFIKIASLLLALLCLPKIAVAQTCDCIDESNCNPCEGGFTSMTFEYSGNLSFGNTYTVEDADGILVTLRPLSSTIVVNKRFSSETFESNSLVIKIYDAFLILNRRIDINANCQLIALGNLYDNGNLKIIAARSLQGPICCEPEDTDQVPPEFVNFPQDVELSLELNCEIGYTWSHPSIIDDCGPTNFVQPFPNNNQTFELGTRYITYFAVDLSGNLASDSFSVTVIDEIPPVITNMPQNISRNANVNCRATVSWPTPSASDNCTVVEFSPSHARGSVFELGTTEVTYTAIDESGNSTSSSFNVVVSDNAAPVFSSFPTTITVPANENCEAAVNWDLPIVDDNCTSNIVPVGSKSPGDIFQLGTTTVNYTAEDESGNSVNRNFNVVVVDDEPPVFSTFPDDIIESVDADACEVAVIWETPEVEDNCSDEASLELLAGSPQSGDLLTIGTYTVSYKTADELGNEATRTFDIVVEDNQGPVFMDCPQDRIVFLESLSCDALVEWADPQVSDNCALRGELVSNIASGTRFGAGTTEIQYTAVDESGNESFCTFNVIVQNNFEPVVENCPQDVELELFDRAGVSHDWLEPTISLECAELTIESNYKPGDLFPEGTTKVEYYYEMNGSREVLCSFVVNVELGEIDFEINQLMTPNGDGQNDFWKINEIENFPKNTVVIVDRWGSEIYTASGYNNESTAWGGSNKKGDLVPTGTYYYFITVEFESSVVKKNGFIELIR